MTDKEKKIEKELWYTSASAVIAIVGAIVLIITAVCGHVCKFNMLKDYEDNTAMLTDASETSYLYAPYHGGKVQTRYEYFLTYTYIVDGEEYTIKVKRNTSYKPADIKLKYNPENPYEIFIDKDAFIPRDADVDYVDWIKFR